MLPVLVKVYKWDGTTLTQIMNSSITGWYGVTATYQAPYTTAARDANGFSVGDVLIVTVTAQDNTIENLIVRVDNYLDA